jgi:3alpha(or 20beta)-hydroxysteroid dehydrogenase
MIMIFMVPDAQRQLGAGRLAGKVAIVTGAAQGLGESITRRFVDEGAAVLVTDVRDDLGEAFAARLRSGGAAASYHHLDVRSEAEWVVAVERCLDELGPVGVLVNNAFVRAAARLLDESIEHWHEALDVNLTGAFLGMRAVLPGMIAAREGAIVNISSANGGDGRGFRSHAAYWASKSGLTGLTKHVGITYGSDGVRANAILPGPMRTPGLSDIVDSVERLVQSWPIPRIAEPDEIAWAAVYLACDESRYMTGATMLIDGGHTTSL